MDFRFKTLERYKVGGTRDRMDLALPLPRTAKGLVYRYCPNDSCAPRLFLLGNAPADQRIIAGREGQIRRQPRTPGETCPYCG
jgi:hypothetical protein